MHAHLVLIYSNITSCSHRRHLCSTRLLPDCVNMGTGAVSQ